MYVPSYAERGHAAQCHAHDQASIRRLSPQRHNVHEGQGEGQRKARRGRHVRQSTHHRITDQATRRGSQGLVLESKQHAVGGCVQRPHIGCPVRVHEAAVERKEARVHGIQDICFVRNVAHGIEHERQDAQQEGHERRSAKLDGAIDRRAHRRRGRRQAREHVRTQQIHKVRRRDVYVNVLELEQRGKQGGTEKGAMRPCGPQR